MLVDADIRRLVLDQADAAVPVAAASLSGWRAVQVRGEAYPVIIRSAGARTDGVLTGELSRNALSRLLSFEGPEYALETVTVTTNEASMTAMVFVGAAACRPAARPWRFAEWQRRHKRASLAKLRSGIRA